MDEKRLEAFRAVLISRRDELAGGALAHREEGFSLGNDGTQDVGDDAANTYARQVLLGLGERERRALWEIEEALERIDDGTFGECAECGDEIGEARLEAVPHAVLCVECKANQERESR